MYFHFITVLLSLIGSSLHVTLDSDKEPKCYSRFDYEEKLLEKAVKNDIQMKQILEMFDNALKAVEVQRKELEVTNVKLAEIIASLEASVVSKVLKTLESKIETRLNPVAFSVRGLQNTKLNRGETLLFETIIQNIDDAFDQISGKFTAPVNGTYLFSVQISTSLNTWGRVKIVHNGNEIQSIVMLNRFADSSKASGTIVQRLSVGDQVCVKQDSCCVDQYLNGRFHGWNHFSGALISL